MESKTDWRAEWTVDVGDDALANAMHANGLGFSLFAVCDSADMPKWICTPSTAYMEAGLLQRDAMGEADYQALLSHLQCEALQLWHELGFVDGDFAAPEAFPSKLPCKVTSWRAAWNVSDDADGLAHAVHASGLEVTFVYTVVDDDESMGWCATTPRAAQTHEEKLRRELGDEALGRLHREARSLWMELGYIEASPRKQDWGESAPKEQGWRSNWEVYDKPGHPGVAVHVIGLEFEISRSRLDPARGGTGWFIADAPQPQALVAQLRSKLGRDEFEAWITELQRQAMTLWRELGHLDSSPSKLPWHGDWHMFGDGADYALHNSGLAFFFCRGLDQASGRWVWMLPGDPDPEELVGRLRKEMGGEKFAAHVAELERQALLLWGETV